MSRWQGPAWAAAGAGALAAGLYLTGHLGSGAGSHQGLQAPSAEKIRPENEAVGTVAIDGDTQRRLGVIVATLAPGSESPSLDGFAKGLDAGPLAAVIGEIDTAQAAASASTAEARRLQNLYRQDVSASRRSVEAAQAQASSDDVRLRVAMQRIGIEIGWGLARLGIREIRHLATEIANGQAALIRIDIPGATLVPGTAVRIGTAQAAETVHVLGAAAAADAKLQSAGVLAVVRGSVAHQSLVGRVIPASVSSGPARVGVLVPPDAVVRFQGGMWVYRQTPEGFARVALENPVIVSNGWLSGGTLNPGDRVAVRGAAGLLALDMGGRGRSGDED